ncbi:MAG: AAA family ATPase [Dehalococcoidia bacterium]
MTHTEVRTPTDSMEQIVTDDLDELIRTLPPRVGEALASEERRAGLLEVVLDLGRLPEARYPSREVVLSHKEVTEEDLDYVIQRVGDFGDDNRAGIERTLHRISCIRNRRGKIVGLTCRIGRAVYGTIRVIEDLVLSEKSILLLGRPGVGKTTMLREVARVLADDANKRVIIVDTSNEIGGDGDIPHPSIGGARRMQVATPALQHAVMIEAVENHMPEVIIIDEIGNELEAMAARTIAERGVQLVGTAHGNNLDNLMANPTLSDLIGGIQSVTLSDEEARRRGTRKSILERKAPPTFDVVVEIQDWHRVAIHEDVAATVDARLRGFEAPPEIRELTAAGDITVHEAALDAYGEPVAERERPARREGPGQGFEQQPQPTVRLLPFAISRGRLEQAIHNLRAPVQMVQDVREADAVITLRHAYRKKPPVIREAEERSLPIYVIKSNTLFQIEQVLLQFRTGGVRRDPLADVYRSTEEAIAEVMASGRSMELAPANSYIRKVQHEIAARYNLDSVSSGKDPYRRVRILPFSPGN